MNNLHIDKIKQVAIFFSDEVSDLYLTKLLKLFYYFDFISVLESGRSATNDTYYHLPYGPVPTYIKDQVKLLKASVRTEEESFVKEENSDFVISSIFSDILELQEKSGRFLIKKKQDVLFDETRVSNYEKQLLKDIVEEFKNSTSSFLSEKTHNEVPYAQTMMGNIIDYKLAFHLNRDKILPRRKYEFSPEVSQAEFFSE